MFCRPDIDDRGEHHEDDHDDGDRGALAEVVLAEGQIPGPVLRDVGRIVRPAIGDGREQVELLQREDQAERNDGADGRAHHRKRDRPETLPGIGAVEFCRFVEIAGDRREANGEQNHVEGRAEPDIGDHDGPEREIGVRAPEDVGADQPALAQNEIQDAEIARQHPVPDRADDEAGHDPGNEEQAAQPVGARKIHPEEKRQAEADQELAGNRADDEQHGIINDRQRFGLLEQIDIVLEADEGAHEGPEAEHVDLLETHDDVVDERQAREHEQEDERQGDKRDVEPAAIGDAGK